MKRYKGWKVTVHRKDGQKLRPRLVSDDSDYVGIARKSHNRNEPCEEFRISGPFGSPFMAMFALEDAVDEREAGRAGAPFVGFAESRVGP